MGRFNLLNGNNNLFSYLLNALRRRRSKIFFYLTYLFCCAFFSLLINLGSAGGEMVHRIQKKRFVPVLLGTILLLLAYAILIQVWYESLVRRPASWRRDKLNFAIYLTCALCSVLAVHGLVLEVLLPSQPGLILLSSAYLTTDFWFFFPIVIGYALLIHRFPGWGLLQLPSFSQIVIRWHLPEPRLPEQKKLLLLTAGAQSASYPVKDDKERSTDEAAVCSDTEEPKSKDSLPTDVDLTYPCYRSSDPAADEFLDGNHLETCDPFLALWKRDRDRPALMVYMLNKFRERELVGQTSIQCLHAVIIYKQQRTADVYRHDGNLCRINVTTAVLRDNPWLVKVRAKVYVNMLYFQVPVDQPTKLELNAEIKIKLQRWLPEDKFRMLVTPSRNLSKNLKDFWGILKTLDERILEEEFDLA